MPTFTVADSKLKLIYDHDNWHFDKIRKYYQMVAAVKKRTVKFDSIYNFFWSALKGGSPNH